MLVSASDGRALGAAGWPGHGGSRPLDLRERPLNNRSQIIDCAEINPGHRGYGRIDVPEGREVDQHELARVDGTAGKRMLELIAVHDRVWRTGRADDDVGPANSSPSWSDAKARPP
jgi:hypothetical protein